MAYSTLSDPYLVVAFWTGIVALGLTLLLGAQIVLLRMTLRRTERREQAVVSAWRPLLHAALMEEPVDALPVLQDAERVPFLKLWVHLHASVRGTASGALNQLAYRLECDRHARRLLKEGNRAERLLSVLALGHLRDAASWEQLSAAASEDDSVLSLNAIWALVQIDGRKAADLMLPRFIERDDWPLARVTTILMEARADCLPLFADILPALSAGRPQTLPRALRIAEGLRLELPPDVMRRLLQHADAPVLVGALRIASGPELLPLIRPLAEHAEWRVRVQVAKALGRTGGREELAVLERLLSDSQWWVRYRAAHALARLPFVGREGLMDIAARCSDRYAADMLRQVSEEGASA
ncbi:HEAT repeat domain-containing protein [Noviherbaspirillum galbum]|uniref:HEAT repeat domain-containing protein n=1 Tax=Noviherbaspirillum galbum TaxID=2709383 RepID=A0A6B3SPL1_9BURK|nr:HEAT repeat domain-containing protein [Noviherbaspirillum galbum]NEX60342.1 HEAT repeat domain-containing protein [Noviherbaspirillum galbum]